MGDKIDRCTKLAPFPQDVASSKKYRTLFNAVAKDLGLALTYVEDVDGGAPNTPEANRGEVEVAPAAWEKYGVHDARPRASAKLTADICRVRAEVERRRRVMTEAGFNLFPLQQSGTYTHDKLAQVNAAERQWVAGVKPAFYEAGMELYTIQALPERQPTVAWMRAHADPISRFQFERIRSAGVPTKAIPDFPDSAAYASSVPWFPASPTFSMMWPVDFTKDELAYVNAHYPDGDPIRLPYTRVSRITPVEAERIRTSPLQSEGVAVEWVREGKDGQLYRVVNMAFDEAMRPYFLKLAEALRANDGVTVAGTMLDPQWQAQVRTMADCFEKGDFVGLLKADLAQATGNLFMTLFPHEGYWADGIKFPMMGEIGVIDTELFNKVAGQGYIFNWLGKKVEAAAHEAGLTDYHAPEFDPSNLRRDAIFIWTLVTTGFMRAYKRDPGGHDYPKVPYPGISGHRSVSLLDTLESWTPLTKAAADMIFGPELGQLVSFDALARTTFLHEGTHGAQIQQTVKTLNGKPFGEALGIYWGALVEPWADAGNLLAHYQLYKDGKISAEQYRAVAVTETAYSLVRLYPRADTLTDGMADDGPHIVGAGMLIGWLAGWGAMTDKGALVEALVDRTLDAFFNELTAYAAKGSLKEFKAFVKQCIESLPLATEQEILAKKAKLPSYTLLDRGELPLHLLNGKKNGKQASGH